MRVLFCSSEVEPLVKTGGLADVSRALPLAMAKLGVEVRLVMPGYRSVVSALPAGRRGSRLAARGYPDDIEEARIGKDVPVYLIKNEKYFGREGIYGDKHGDYPDNLERFAFFCRRALELLKEINYKPDVIHCNDWQTGLIPVYLKTVYAKDGFYSGIKTLFTIHNLAYQGVFSKKEYPKLGLDWSLFNMDGLEFYDKINFLKGGLLFSDSLNTVSPSYAKEIRTKEFGCGLEGILKQRKNDLSGILNGLDNDYWNPKTDGYLYKPYSSGNMEDKYVNKERLLKDCSLEDDNKFPLFGMVGRLVEQKGLDLICKSLGELIRHFHIQLIILGKGEEKYNKLLRDASRKYPGHLRLFTDFNEELAHRIYAGCDIFLMPSYYEPCGLGQMIALRYGSIPLVFKTGGLSDTISQKNGFVFDSYTVEGFVKAVKEALSVYQDKERWGKLVRRAFSCDFSWNEPAKRYLELYKSLGV